MAWAKIYSTVGQTSVPHGTVTRGLAITRAIEDEIKDMKRIGMKRK